MNDLVKLFYIKKLREYRLAIHQSVLDSFPNLVDEDGDSAFSLSLCDERIYSDWGITHEDIPHGYSSKRTFCNLEKSKTLLRLSRKLLGPFVPLNPSDYSTSDDECIEIFV